MAENKKSFIVYCEWQESFNELSDVEAGILIKHIFAYVNDENPVCDNKFVNLGFIPIKQTLKRDLVKYESYIEKQRVNGQKGGRPKKTQKTQRLISKPKKADSVNVNDNDIHKVYIPTYEDFKLYAFKKTKDINYDALRLKYDAWIENGWKDGNNKPIKNWKSKLLHTLTYLKKHKTYTDKL